MLISYVVFGELHTIKAKKISLIDGDIQIIADDGTTLLYDPKYINLIAE